MKRQRDKALEATVAFMVKTGIPTTGRWCHYSSAWEAAKGIDRYSNTNLQKARKTITGEIKWVGINWKRTPYPEVTRQSCFEGTFEDSSYREVSLQTITLKDGTVYKMGTDRSVASLTEFAQMFFDTMEDLDEFGFE